VERIDRASSVLSPQGEKAEETLMKNKGEEKTQGRSTGCLKPQRPRKNNPFESSIVIGGKIKHEMRQ